jgi:beta-lactamase class A
LLENVTFMQDEHKSRKSCLKSVVYTTPAAMRALLLPLLILPVLTLASCSMPGLLASTAPHKIKLKNGREVLCSGQPQYQEKTGYYRYRTTDHRDAVIRADEVAGILGKDA